MGRQHNPRTGGRGIEWTDRTENPIGGCMHGCKWIMPDGQEAGCYAADVAAGMKAKNGSYQHGFEHHYWRGERGVKSLTAGEEPELIFCDSMSDLFGAHVPDEHVLAVLDAMATAPHHTYQSLTKAPGRLLKFIDRLPANLWVGVSSPPDYMFGRRLDLTQQHRMLAKTMEVFVQIRQQRGNVCWLSIEPLSWHVAPIIPRNAPVDWCVIGAASRGRKYYQPEPAHLRMLLHVLDVQSVPIFFKGNLRQSIDIQRRLGRWPERLTRWREDFPRDWISAEPCRPYTPAVARRQQRCVQFGWTLDGGAQPMEVK